MVYHTGIVLYDTEHMYAAGQTSVAGILEHRPRQSGDPQWVFKESIRLGETNKSRQECRALIAQLKNSGEWRGDAYNVMRKSVKTTETQVALLFSLLFSPTCPRLALKIHFNLFILSFTRSDCSAERADP
jgi:hypothetical protein